MAAIRPCTGTTADWKAVEDRLILKEREVGVEIDTSGHYQIRQGDGKKKRMYDKTSRNKNRKNQKRNVPIILQTPLANNIKS